MLPRRPTTGSIQDSLTPVLTLRQAPGLERDVVVDGPDAAARHQIEPPVGPVDQAIRQPERSDEGVGVRFDAAEEQARRSAVRADGEIREIGQYAPAAVPRFANQHEGEVRILDNVSEAGVDLGGRQVGSGPTSPFSPAPQRYGVR